MAKFPVELELIASGLSKALETEMSKITGVVTASVKAQEGVQRSSREKTSKDTVTDATQTSAAVDAVLAAAEKRRADMRAAFSKEVWGTEKKAAEAIVSEIAKLQDSTAAKADALKDASVTGDVRKAIQAAKNAEGIQLASMRKIALENERIAKHGEGASVGILGVGRNIENVYGKVNAGIGKMAGGLGLAAVGGMTLHGTMESVWEATRAIDEQMDQMEDTFAAAGVPAEQIESSIQATIAHAAEWGDKMNVPRDRVREIAIGITGLTGLVGEQAQQATELAIGYENASGGILKAEQFSKLLTKSIGDPENEKSLKILESKYPGIGAQMAAAASEQEKLNVLQQAASPVFAQMEERASGMWDRFEVGIRGALDSSAEFLASQHDNIATATTMAGAIGPMVGMIKNLGVAEKAAAVAKQISAGAQWLLNAAMAANPIVLVVAGVVALVAVFVLLYNKVEFVRVFIDKLWETIKSGISWLGSLLGITEENTEATEKSTVAVDAATVARNKEAQAIKDQRTQLENFLSAREKETKGIDQAVTEAEKTLEGIRARLKHHGEWVNVNGRMTLKLDTEETRATLRQREKEWAEHVKNVQGIKGKEDSASDSVKAPKAEKADPNKALNDAIKAAEAAHAEELLKLRKQFLDGTIKTEEEYKIAQLNQEKSYKSAVLDAHKKHGGEVEKASRDLRSAELDIEEDKKKRLLAKAQELYDQLKAQREAARKDTLTLIASNMENELHAAEVKHLREQTAEEEHQRALFEIKRNALLKQIAMMGLLSKEGLDAMVALQKLNQQEEIRLLSAKESGYEQHKDKVQVIQDSLTAILNIGEQAKKAKEDEEEQHREAMANFKGTLMERNKLEREHQEKMKQIDEQAARDKRNVVIDQIEALAMKALANAMGWIFETIPFPFSLIAAAGAGVAVPALFGALKQFKDGGYTGEGNPNEVAGITHKDEFVLKSGSFEVDRNGRLVSVQGAPVGLAGSARLVGSSAGFASGSGRDRTDEVLSELRKISAKDQAVVMSEKRMLLSNKRGTRSLSRETV